jgi:FlaA1/EpsC-like NDP-sugar epimerase
MVFAEYRPEVVYHAAAYKHVPMVEHNQAAGILNNVWGTYFCATIAQEFGAKRFVLISTDKAVRPTSVMGASKRLAEMVLQALADQRNGAVQTYFTMVRFGNVLGSSGSVVPLFRRQINDGGPITLTHPEVTRYFMAIAEASQLVIQAGSMARGGEVFLLDMGSPVRILDLAQRMVELSGLRVRNEQNPQGDIEIKVTGLRPGEKLYEELLIGNNPLSTQHPKIMKAEEAFVSLEVLLPKLKLLKLACENSDQQKMRDLLADLIPEYGSHSGDSATSIAS